MQRTSFLLLLLLTLSFARAQEDRMIWMKPVDIRSYKFSFSDPSMKIQELDTTPVSRVIGFTIADRLDRESGLFLKSYGPGSLATVTLRGCGAAHTALTWNGLSLNSPMLGVSDFSLLPSFLIDAVTLQYGGNGPLAGSGAVAGVLQLQSALDFRKEISSSVLLGYGSFGQQQAGLGFTLSDGHLVSKSRVYTQSATNNFPFVNPEGKSVVQQHAQFRQMGFTEDLLIGKVNNKLGVHLWYLENEREIPPGMLSRISEQEQKDRALRLAANWTLLGKKWNWGLQGGMNREYILYTDPAALLDETSNALSFQSAAQLGYTYSTKLQLTTHFSVQHAEADCEGYRGSHQQEQVDVGLKAVYETEKLYLNGSLRQGWMDRQEIPFLPALNIRFRIHPALSWRADISSVYRVPTLNDRYWVPGGNPSLKPESGFTTSTGLQWKCDNEKYRLQMEAGVFFTRIREAIVWMPDPNGIYTSGNVQEQESKGFEGNADATLLAGNWKFRVVFSASVGSSLMVASGPAYAAGIGKQMIYTPRLLYKSQGEISYRHLELRYYHNYTGYRYTTLDHHYFLEPFSQAELVLAWNGRLFSQALTVSFHVKNLYDENYQVIAWRAMPGRSYHAGLLYTFGK